MSKDRNIILRVQSPEGTKRIEIRGSETTCALFEQIYNLFSLNSFAFALYKEQNQKNEIASSKTRTLNDIGLKHGDMIYLLPLNGAVLFPSSSTTVPIRKKTRAPAGEPGPSTRANDEDIVDLLLYKEDGKIERGKDPKLCRHMDKSRCVNCSPLEPYDENYLREHNIKHLSFHAYIRKMTSGVDKGKFLALEDISCSIKEGCKEHPPWPKGICSKCQPNAITLNRQPYRHVDNVAFENKNIVERFLNYWRSTGQQRVGYLYGTYELHSDVPLGIRANVVAIYEPPQESGRDYNQLLPDPKDEIVENLAHNLGLRRVGWIFTDLLPEDTQKGTVKHLRNIDSHFLTAHECIMAGHFQNLHANPCKYSSSGFFGSKFATVCVTGDKTNQVHMEGYQVSNQCMALVRDDCLIPTKDAPELGYVRESSDKQFVPDVYYKEKDDYGNEVSRLGRPLPVEYLLVDVPASTPVSPSYTFNSDTNKRPFVIENRFLDGEIQDFNALNQYLSQFAPNEFFTAINDFHFLIYIATMDMLPMMEYMGPLLDALKEKNHEAAEEWSRSEHWATIKQLIAASSPIPSSLGNEASEANAGVASSSGQASWTCSHCTFLNTSEVNNCEMCNLPRSAA